MIAEEPTETLVSPLRYPGSKRWIVRYLSKILNSKHRSSDCFIEPFSGGASASLLLLQQGLVQKIGISELDPLIASFWQTLFYDTDWLIKKIHKTDVTLAKWLYYKELEPKNTREQALKCLFLNRTSFSGILKNTAGPIGGKTQASKYKIDCRFTKETIIKRIRQIAQYHKQVAFIWNHDWKTAMERIKQLQQKGEFSNSVFYYFDPPFYKKGKRLYRFFFEHNDHLELCDFLYKFKQPWMLSYDFCPEIVEMYRDRGLNTSNVSLFYATSNKRNHGKGRELILSNLSLVASGLGLGKNRRAEGTRKLSSTNYAQYQLPL